VVNLPTVVVGMSGGVDSSVTAWLLKEQGYRVIALFMKNWEEEEGGPSHGGLCPAQQDYEDVVAVCTQLQIPHYTVNFSQEYWDLVFAKCLQEYSAGYTPNPDILCNKEIKFNLFLRKGLELGADFIATGHYCRKIMHRGEWILGKGVDSDKDQSYFLYTLNTKILEKVLFPLGEMTKKEVRTVAQREGLITATKKDSTGICFIGKRDFKTFISQYIPHQPGNFETGDGKVVGRHDGIAYYTIGQRRGLKLGGAGEAWYVVKKDLPRNVIIVERGEAHPELYKNFLIASEVTWVGTPPLLPIACSAKIRYRATEVPCTLLTQGGNLKVYFEMPQKAITAGQSIVFYQNDLCLGGGLIT
jgi:tRNA-uridine 2-sulfurtransferase